MGKGRKSVNTPATGSKKVKGLDPKTTSPTGGGKPKVTKMYSPPVGNSGLKGR